MQITWMFAHETAHIWCSGANVETWEDWLNETTAEWSALLFTLHKKDPELFDEFLKPKLARYEKLPPIKTRDGSRPEGVHDKGTVLFYRIYQKFGYETMKKVVRCFADLEEKNTANFLTKLRECGLTGAAVTIEENLSRF